MQDDSEMFDEESEFSELLSDLEHVRILYRTDNIS